MAGSTTYTDQVIGSINDDELEEGYADAQGKVIGQGEDSHDKINGHEGDDTIIVDGGSDLAAGDMVGNEWQFIDGKWVYNADLISTAAPITRNFDDTIYTGSGNDVLLGNGGQDMLYAGAGDDILNAGTGHDRAFGQDGDDILNLEDGHDYAEGGLGDDIVNGGAGNDTILGDTAENLLSDVSGKTSFAQFGDSGAWFHSPDEDSISQSVTTKEGEGYEITFELASNLDAGHISGKVEVLWNGEVVGMVDTNSAEFSSHSIAVFGTGDATSLTFRAIEPEPDPNAPIYNFDGPVVSYEKEMSFGDQSVTVDAFAPGQSNLYQVIDGQLKVFDIEAKEYIDAGDPPGFKINGIGFNQETDTIYGIAKGNGVDALGNEVSVTDIVMIDASGDVYRVGDGFYGDYVGDFDDSGNLWTFQSSLNRISKVDVDHLDADGNPVITHIDLPNGIFTDRTYDIAYNSSDGNFYAVVAPTANGGAGKVVKIDLSGVENGEGPSFQELDITGTLYDGEMANGMAKGAYGAVFMDGDGNLYYGLNGGDHDLGTMGDAANKGAIYKVNVDWDTGQAYSEFISEAQATRSNDGAVDPRSMDAFTQVDESAMVLIRNPEVTETAGGNDDLRGGTGDDTIFGNAGDDILHGGEGDDRLSGDQGNDNLTGGQGDDTMFGGEGADRLRGGEGADSVSGGAGNDYLHAGSGDDVLSDGAGNDKVVGGAGSDRIITGAGDDHIWGGNWWKDGEADTFVISAGSGKDMIHDFEIGTDQIDLSAYGLEFDDLQNAMTNKGWATEIDLSKFSGGQQGDKLILKSVDQEDLDESSFIL